VFRAGWFRVTADREFVDMAMESLRELTPISTKAARNLKNSLFFHCILQPVSAQPARNDH
jgi:hypothetical protein